VRPTSSVIRPADAALAAAAEVLNAASRVTILAGAGCAGARVRLIDLAAALKAPVLHAFRGKEFVEYDNPYDVGMTGHARHRLPRWAESVLPVISGSSAPTVSRTVPTSGTCTGTRRPICSPRTSTWITGTPSG
jgi:Thiamine pyrophosphate enzyme, central domain